MRRRWWLCGGGALLLGGATAALFLEPTGVGRGYLRGEEIYHLRPTSHWRELLRAEGEQGRVSRDVSGKFWDYKAAFPVLRQCARDPDPKVRWPAISILGRPDRGTPGALEVLMAALDDEDTEVRIQAVAALGEWGPKARPAVPALVARLHDPVEQIVHWADQALWAIDADEGAKASGWRRITSAELGFSVEMPGVPKREDKPGALAPLLVHLVRAPHRAGTLPMPTLYTVAVIDYPDELIQATTEEERLDSYRQNMGLWPVDAKMVREAPIALQGRKGREQTIEAKDLGTIHSRLFWSGRRLYQVYVASQPKFLNKRAADYFQKSFRFEDAKEKSTGKGGADTHRDSP